MRLKRPPLKKQQILEIVKIIIRVISRSIYSKMRPKTNKSMRIQKIIMDKMQDISKQNKKME